MKTKTVIAQPSGFSFVMDFIHNHVMYLNNSKYFAGVVMILLNVGSKFISIQFSKSTEEYLKYSVSKLKPLNNIFYIFMEILVNFNILDFFSNSEIKTFFYGKNISSK